MPNIGTLLRRGLLTLLILVSVVFLGDFLSIKFQIPNRPQTQDLQVKPLLAVPVKGGKTEYIMGIPETQTCSTSLFPQLGYSPCWYLKRHSKQPVNM